MVFKQRNDAIKAMAKEVLPDEETDMRLRFTCECANEDCRETIEMSVKEYEAARQNDHEFIIKPGHEQPDIEQVVKRSGYAVVEKYELPATTDGKLKPT